MRSFLSFGLATGLALVASNAFGQTPNPSFVEGEILVKFKPGNEATKFLIHAAQKSKVKLPLPQIATELIRLAPGTTVAQGIARYKAYSAVEYAEPNYRQQYFDVPNDTLFGQQYGANRMRLPQAWDITMGDPSVIVAIIDSGTDINHPDLAGNIFPGHDFIDGDGDPSPTDEPHGTHVSGIAGAVANNGLGVAGMGRNCRIMGLRHNLTIAVSAAAMMYAADNGAKVVNMSYGYVGPPTDTERNAVDYAWSRNVLLVSAAGNFNYSGLDSWPNGFDKVISVGATTPSDQKAGFSDFGPRVDVAAPGVSIISTYWPGNGYQQNDGTSMASPGVAGVAALLYAHGGPSITNQEVRDALESTTDPVGSWLRFGRINAERALTAIRPLVNVDVDSASVSVLEGTHSGGDLASLLDSDNNHYRIATANVNRVGAVASAVVEFELPFAATEVRDSALVLEVSGIRLATNFVYFWNWNTSQWTSVKQFPLTASDATNRLEMGTSIKNYVKNNKFRILTRAQMNLRRGGAQTPFVFKIDRATVEARIQL